MRAGFTPSHRGGSGPPLVCLHGFTDTWRTWELVLPALERQPRRARADAPRPRAAARRSRARSTRRVLADAVERAMDEAGFATAHLAGNSLGGYVALQLAARGRARSVVALAPAGGWAAGDESFRDTLDYFTTMQAQLASRRAARRRDRRHAARAGAARRSSSPTRFEHIPPELLAHQIRGAAACTAAAALIEFALRAWLARSTPTRIDVPGARSSWGTADRLLPWPSAAARYRDDWLPHADWVELDGVGHCPQLDVPLEAAQLILGGSAG